MRGLPAAYAKQFRLKDQWHIFWQGDATFDAQRRLILSVNILHDKKLRPHYLA
jgi:hypothetical protein